MPQMAPISWTLMYIIIIFLYLVLAILNFYMFLYKNQSSSFKNMRKSKFWK
uniref:ATP synthase complex subunit 8 n=1 Tax=Trigonopterus ancora TaxID=2896812 RepID=A0A7H1KHY2_9CUCU|nr:ATP synthase F0 subunit 8 [Trigonopterus ancora]